MIFRLSAFIVFLPLLSAAWATEPSLTKEELLKLLGSDQVVILDVRHPRDWQASDRKIPGAIRITDGDFSPIKALSRDKQYVLYCA